MKLCASSDTELLLLISGCQHHWGDVGVRSNRMKLDFEAVIYLFEKMVSNQSMLRQCEQSKRSSIKLEIKVSILQVAFFLPQLVQLLRSDESGLTETFLLDSASRSIVFAHHLVCTLRVRFILRDLSYQHLSSTSTSLIHYSLELLRRILNIWKSFPVMHASRVSSKR